MILQVLGEKSTFSKPWESWISGPSWCLKVNLFLLRSHPVNHHEIHHHLVNMRVVFFQPSWPSKSKGENNAMHLSHGKLFCQTSSNWNLSFSWLWFSRVPGITLVFWQMFLEDQFSNCLVDGRLSRVFFQCWREIQFPRPIILCSIPEV